MGIREMAAAAVAAEAAQQALEQEQLRAEHARAAATLVGQKLGIAVDIDAVVLSNSPVATLAWRGDGTVIRLEHELWVRCDRSYKTGGGEADVKFRICNADGGEIPHPCALEVYGPPEHQATREFTFRAKKFESLAEMADELARFDAFMAARSDDEMLSSGNNQSSRTLVWGGVMYACSTCNYEFKTREDRAVHEEYVGRTRDAWGRPECWHYRVPRFWRQGVVSVGVACSLGEA